MSVAVDVKYGIHKESLSFICGQSFHTVISKGCFFSVRLPGASWFGSYFLLTTSSSSGEELTSTDTRSPMGVDCRRKLHSNEVFPRRSDRLEITRISCKLAAWAIRCSCLEDVIMLVSLYDFVLSYELKSETWHWTSVAPSRVHENECVRSYSFRL